MVQKIEYGDQPILLHIARAVKIIEFYGIDGHDWAVNDIERVEALVVKQSENTDEETANILSEAARIINLLK